ncbi:MAG: Fic family protein [Propionibacteriaceae bacterium]|jgi:Fic family protein|nr:Fic family protein [Propionibacteriaceae bacterium]
MSDELPVDATSFITTLLQERQQKTKGGLYHLNQILMAYNTNRIEGSQLTEDQTRYIYETRTVEGAVRIDDVVETSDHFRMLDLMLENVGRPLTCELIKGYHRLLKAGTSDAALDWFAVGDWKRTSNTVGGIDTAEPEQVDGAIRTLLADYPAERAMAFDDVCDFHFRFETIHPFQDGNGRVGRLIMFGQCLANGIMPFIVLDSERFYYYRGLSEYAVAPGYLRDTFRHFQDVYHDMFKKYVAVR